MATADIAAPTPAPTDPQTSTAYLVFDTESVPDGRLLSLTKYPGANLTAEEAVRKAQQEASEHSRHGSTFLPVTFQHPVAVCVARVGSDLSLQAVTCLDAPQYRPRQIVSDFWRGVSLYPHATLVSFNGRAFDLPLLELAAFRYGLTARAYFGQRRNSDRHLDLLNWFGNHGATRPAGGLDLYAKLLGLPGKMGMTGEQVYTYYREGRLSEINDYCMFDTLDTYFVFLRTRVLIGEITLEQEHDLVSRARDWLTSKVKEKPALRRYLDSWRDWHPWP